MPSTGIAADPAMKQHDPGPTHPERPARYTAVTNELEASGLMHDLVRIEVRSASDDELALVHTRDYIALVEAEVAQGIDQLSTGDTVIGLHSAEAARLAVGCTVSAVDAVFARQVNNAFSVVRPPGHHASAARGMGFCLFNNIAIAARYAQTRYGAGRVLIADWDVHHGNGTQDIFYADPSVLFFSTHQSPWYPGTGLASEDGEGRARGGTINCPLPAGSGACEVIGAFTDRLIPSARSFQPDVVFISAGFDSRIGDPLGQFRLSDDDFRELTRLMMDFADECCSGRLISVLEGGYNLAGLAAAAKAHVETLLYR